MEELDEPDHGHVPGVKSDFPTMIGDAIDASGPSLRSEYPTVIAQAVDVGGPSLRSDFPTMIGAAVDASGPAMPSDFPTMIGAAVDAGGPAMPSDFPTSIGTAIDVDAFVRAAQEPAPPTMPAAEIAVRMRSTPPPLPSPYASAAAPPSPAAAEPLTGSSQLAADGDEADLRRELMAGSFQAGEQLVALYASDAAHHSRDLLAVRRQQAAIRPGDLIALARLHEAAALDGNAPFANAVEHVLGVFDSSGGAPPPPLGAQRDAPALVSSLLFRQVDSIVNEALAIVWETGLYRRDTASYGLTGVERVQPNAGTPLAETFASLLRLFGLGRVWLFHRRMPGPVRAEVALLTSPSVVLSGDIVPDSPELLYELGATLTASMPEHALVNGMPEDELRTLIDALVAAFGPLDAAPRGNRAVVRLEQSLWQLIPPRAERRLREICAHPEAFSFDSAVQSTRLAMRRAGLFACGSLSTAVRIVAARDRLRPRAPPHRARRPRPRVPGEPGHRRSRAPLDPHRIRRGPLAPAPHGIPGPRVPQVALRLIERPFRDSPRLVW